MFNCSMVHHHLSLQRGHEEIVAFQKVGIVLWVRLLLFSSYFCQEVVVVVVFLFCLVISVLICQYFFFTYSGFGKQKLRELWFLFFCPVCVLK